jgi:hypothetical protein
LNALKIMPVERCGAVGKCMASPASYASSFSSWSKPSGGSIAKKALAALEEARAKDVATHEANLPALANNAQIHEAVKAMMDGFGIPLRWSERDLKSRSRYPKTISHDAGYLTDLRREVPISDGFEAATLSYNRLLADYQRYAEAAAREAEQAKRAKEREDTLALEKRRADIELATLILRYELPEHSDWSDVLEALRVRDQRLDLAVAMSLTRGDWSEGFYRVSDAVSRFTIRDDVDKEIINDVLGCMDSDDGRVFRDTRWNYGELFARAKDQQLAQDVQKAMSRMQP